MKIKLLLILLLAILALAGCADGTDYPEAENVSPEENGVLDAAPGTVELVESVEALELFSEGTEAEVYDIETGITYRVRRVTGGYNTLADVETLTLQDTENLLLTAGGEWNVMRRAIVVTVGGRRIAASIAPFEHSGSEDHPFGEIIDNRSGMTGTGINLDSIRDNGMAGVVDIYFFNSLTPGINRVDARHQDMVMRAYGYEG